MSYKRIETCLLLSESRALDITEQTRYANDAADTAQRDPALAGYLYAIHSRLAELAEEAGDLEEAERKLLRNLEIQADTLHPDTGYEFYGNRNESLQELGDFYLRNGQKDKAIALLKTEVGMVDALETEDFALEQQPGYWLVWLLAAEDVEAAQHFLNQLSALDDVGRIELLLAQNVLDQAQNRSIPAARYEQVNQLLATLEEGDLFSLAYQFQSFLHNSPPERETMSLRWYALMYDSLSAPELAPLREQLSELVDY